MEILKNGHILFMLHSSAPPRAPLSSQCSVVRYFAPFWSFFSHCLFWILCSWIHRVQKICFTNKLSFHSNRSRPRVQVACDVDLSHVPSHRFSSFPESPIPWFEKTSVLSASASHIYSFGYVRKNFALNALQKIDTTIRDEASLIPESQFINF